VKFSVAIKLLRLLNADPAHALTTSQIAEKWQARYNEIVDIRSFQRWMGELSADGADGDALVNIDDSSKEFSYYLKLNELAHWFMTEETAFYQLLSHQVLNNTFGESTSQDVKRQIEVATRLTEEESRLKRLRERVRIVPDGIGRLRTQISNEVLSNIMETIAAGQMLQLQYLSSRGNLSQLTLNPLGLVAKDGTLYLLAVKELSDPPIHYALQRVQSAKSTPKRAQDRTDFDLDRYIYHTHQLSHALDQMCVPELIKLKVQPQTLFHFKERPLSENQTIIEPTKEGDWAVVTALIPITILLRPFLASMGPGIEVLEPLQLRQDLAKWVNEMTALYK
jgi:hypothetical protein